MRPILSGAVSKDTAVGAEWLQGDVGAWRIERDPNDMIMENSVADHHDIMASSLLPDEAQSNSLRCGVVVELGRESKRARQGGAQIAVVCGGTDDFKAYTWVIRSRLRAVKETEASWPHGVFRPH